MKVVIAGGTGQIGAALIRDFSASGHQIALLSRRQFEHPDPNVSTFVWDGEARGDWFEAVDGADVVINLAGRTVNCRYTPENLKQMMDSRVRSTQIVGEAIAEAATPPPVWLQMSTATIYAHRFDAANDEHSGVIGGNEPDVPEYWGYSVKIAQNWEKALEEAQTPATRKVALRTAMVMTPDRDGVFDVLYKMCRRGLGGSIGGGRQYVSWIHEYDFIGAVKLLIADDTLTGPFNLAAPAPLPQGEFMAILRESAGAPFGLPATAWMAEVGAFFLRTDTELLLKSRRVIPTRLLESGYTFQFSDWASASQDLVARH